MSPRVPRLRWDDPFRALDMLASLWSSTGMSLVSAGAAQAVAAPYRTLFTTRSSCSSARKSRFGLGTMTWC